MKKNILVFISLYCLLYSTINAQTEASDFWNLTRCLEHAKENNLTVKSAELGLESASINLKQSKIGLLPNLSAGASQTLNGGTNIDPITGDYIATQTSWSTSFGLNAQVYLYNGNKQYNQIQQNKLLVEQNSLIIEEVKNDITLSILEAYLLSLYYKEGIVVAEGSVNTTKKQLEQAKAKLDIGALTSKDYASIASQHAQNEYALVNAVKQYDLQLLALKQLLELQGVEGFTIAAPDIDINRYLLIPNKNDVYDAAVNTFPEIKSGNLQVDINERSLKIARGGYIPTLSLSGSLSTGYTGTQHFSFKDQMRNNFSQRVSLSLNIPIFSKYQNRANELNAKINIEEAKINLAIKNKDLYTKIENVWQNAVSSINEMKAAESVRDAAKIAYDISRKQFEIGALSATDLVISENTYTAAELKLLQTKYSIIIYYQMLQFYQGNQITL